MIRNSVKNKIIVTFCLIIAFSLIISGGVAYKYCFDILKNQSLKDEVIKIGSTARHMDYITDDIRKFALTIMVDRNIQNYLKMSNDNFIEVSNLSSRIKDELSELEVQRDYILDIILLKGENMIFSKAQLGVYLDQEYYAKRLQEPWYADFVNLRKNSGFAASYDLPEREGRFIKTIPYIVNIKDISSPQMILGQMILNLNYDYLKKFLIEDSKDSDDFFWIDSFNNVLFQKDPMDNKLSQHEVDTCIGRTEAGCTGYFNTDHGYLIIDRTMQDGWILCSYIFHDRIYKETKYLIYFFVLYTAGILVFTILIILPIVSSITKPLSNLTKVMKSVTEGNLDVTIPIKGDDELAVLSKGFNIMLSSLRSYFNRLVEYEKEKKKIEFNLLLAQINPHFIYNTLHTVIYMANKTKNYDIVNMVKSFIAVLQDTVKINEEGLLTTLRHEIDVVREYLVIQHYRYRDRFDVEWEIDDMLLECKVPRTILQPIVENSILHGILPLNRKGLIKITAEEKADSMIIIVQDNGAGMDKEAVQSLLTGNEGALLTGKMRSIGVHNVLGRIKYICGEKYGIDIQSERDIFTRFTIKLPVNL